MRKIIGEIRKSLTPVYGDRETEGLIRCIFGELCGMSYTDILLKDTKLSAEKTVQINSAVERLLRKEPVQYILGYAWFCGIRMKVAPGVLIPRPETAEMAELIVKENTGGGLRILDICTGSGCIAVALAKSLPGVYVSAVDISRTALSIARENAALCGVNIDFSEQDILKCNADGLGRYDIIVSNPPYISEYEKSGMDDNVLCHEPHEALFVPDEDPILFYSRIAAIGLDALVPGGRLYFEINPLFSREVAEMLGDNGYSDICVIKDMYGKERIIRCVK